MKGPFVGFLTGSVLLAIGEAPIGSPDIEGLLKIGGTIVAITGAILTAKHLAEKAQKTGEAADQRASAVGGKVDNLRTAHHDLESIVIEIKTEQKRDQEEIKRLRELRHDYIDKELNPRLMRFENNVEEDLEKMGARLAVAEALIRGRE